MFGTRLRLPQLFSQPVHQLDQRALRRDGCTVDRFGQEAVRSVGQLVGQMTGNQCCRALVPRRLLAPRFDRTEDELLSEPASIAVIRAGPNVDQRPPSIRRHPTKDPVGRSGCVQGLAVTRHHEPYGHPHDANDPDHRHHRVNPNLVSPSSLPKSIPATLPCQEPVKFRSQRFDHSPGHVRRFGRVPNRMLGGLATP